MRPRPATTEAGEQTASLIDAPPGITDVSTEEAGRLRVYSRPITYNGRRLGTFRVADPRAPIDSAQSALRNTFLLVGAIALLFSIVIAAWLATLITRPLRRIASVASDVDAGDLSHRIGDMESSDEVHVLAESFDHMLNRLEGAFRRQREFLSDASHELRTPLTVVRGQTELLRRVGEDPEERRRVVDMLLREIDQMNRLVDDMLSLARAEAGELVRPQAVDLAEFLEDLERDLPLLGDRDFRVEGVRQGTLQADPERLSQVFRNLVSNAVRHTGAGGPDHGLERGPRRADRVLRGRHRGGDSARPARADLRPLLPDRRGTGPRSRRKRARPADRARDRRGPRRADLGRVNARRRRDGQVRDASLLGRPAGSLRDLSRAGLSAPSQGVRGWPHETSDPHSHRSTVRSVLPRRPDGSRLRDQVDTGLGLEAGHGPSPDQGDPRDQDPDGPCRGEAHDSPPASGRSSTAVSQAQVPVQAPAKVRSRVSPTGGEHEGDEGDDGGETEARDD